MSMLEHEWSGGEGRTIGDRVVITGWRVFKRQEPSTLSSAHVSPPRHRASLCLTIDHAVLHALRLLVDAKDGAGRDVGVDVGRAVEGIEDSDILAADVDEAMTPTLPVKRRARLSTSLVTTSSFFCSSP
eukprot:580103-Hanusia_phi.AAC.2